MQPSYPLHLIGTCWEGSIVSSPRRGRPSVVILNMAALTGRIAPMITVGPASLSIHINNEARNAVWILGLLNETFEAPLIFKA